MKRRPRLRKLLIIFTLVISMIASSIVVSHGSSYEGKYWLKVNTKANVVTVYEKINGKWTPIRAMLCSVGLGTSSDNSTPQGTFYTKGKWQWGHLVDNLWGQYCTHIVSDILFHSVYYDFYQDYASQPTKEFNKLGSPASHGCVRLSTMDAKWVYDNCSVGTKVTIYEDSNPGPLGKPEGIKVSTKRKRYWDPTDPNKDNPYYLLKKPVINVSSNKKLTIKYGSSYKLKSNVTAIDPNTFMDLTSKIKVSSIKKYSTTKKEYVDATFSTKKLGTYKITYKVFDKYSGTTYKTVKLNVVDNLSAPIIYGAVDKTIPPCTSNAVQGITASQLSCDRTQALQIYILTPGSDSYRQYSYMNAKTFMFSKVGEYKVKYKVKNKYSPYKERVKVITITVKE